MVKNVYIRFIGNEELINFSVECLKVQLEENIKCRRQEVKSIKEIEAKIINIE